MANNYTRSPREENRGDSRPGKRTSSGKSTPERGRTEGRRTDRSLDSSKPPYRKRTEKTEGGAAPSFGKSSERSRSYSEKPGEGGRRRTETGRTERSFNSSKPPYRKRTERSDENAAPSFRKTSERTRPYTGKPAEGGRRRPDTGSTDRSFNSSKPPYRKRTERSDENAAPSFRKTSERTRSYSEKPAEGGRRRPDTGRSERNYNSTKPPYRKRTERSDENSAPSFRKTPESSRPFTEKPVRNERPRIQSREEKPYYKKEKPIEGKNSVYSAGTSGLNPDSESFKSSTESSGIERKPRSMGRNAERSKAPGQMRLNRFISNAGICSRRNADKWIVAGMVTVNGKVVNDLGAKVFETDDVRFDGQKLNPEKKVYVLLNKPKGYVTTNEDPHAELTVMELVKHACPERIYPVGRLDKNTTGLLLFTNDGDLSKRLTHPSHNVKKIYQVTLDKNLTKEDMLSISEGVELEDGPIAADAISYINMDDKTEIGVEIHSGRNRVVRRIFEHLGYHVRKLDRVYFAGLTKKNIPRGKFRILTDKEVNFLKMQ
jgi:23S rRNA pseudouridine2605 synthase